MNAHWIWAHNLQGTDEVWCRITTGNHPYDDGMFAMTEGFNDGQLHIGADDSATIYIVRLTTTTQTRHHHHTNTPAARRRPRRRRRHHNTRAAAATAALSLRSLPHVRCAKHLSPSTPR